MNVDSAPRDTQQRKTPQRPLSGTPCLDAIKRIRKIRGTSCRTHLVSIAVDVSTRYGGSSF